MLKIRLQRTGRKHEPTYRVVLTDSKNGPKSGKFIEILGNYDARRNDETQLKAERIQYWVAQGAQPSDTVHNLLVKHKVIAGEKRNVLPQKTPIKKEGEEAVADSVTAEQAAPVATEVAVEETSTPETTEEVPVAEEVSADVEETPVVVEESSSDEVAEDAVVEEAEEEKKEA